MLQLRDGTYTSDPRLDRLEQFDSRSLNYRVTDAVPKNHLAWEGLERISKVRIKAPSNHLNQGREGACVGMGLTNALRYEPYIGDPLRYNEDFARVKVYWEAQKNDPFPGGEYPGASPRMEGTSLLAGVQQLKALGLISSYRWAFSIEELLLGIGYFGVAIVGVGWYSWMFEPNRDGLIKVGGSVEGGHCVAIVSYNKESGLLRIAQSWGNRHGINGEVFIHIDDMARLLYERGECVFLEKVVV